MICHDQGVYKQNFSTTAPSTPDHFAVSNFRFNSNKAVADILYAAEQHPEWISSQCCPLPPSGSQFLYVRGDSNWYKNDGYDWKRRQGARLTREDHMKLKVNKQEIITGNYAHSALVPTFHRRIYWLTDNPSYVFVHYLNDEKNVDIHRLASKITESVETNRLTLSYQNLYPQLLAMYRGLLNDHAISDLCNLIISTNGNGGFVDRTVDIPEQPSQSSSVYIERRNSCSSAFRKGLSSVTLQRQPSTFSDSVAPSFAGAIVTNFGNDLSARNHILQYQHDNVSHSGETRRSSNPDDDKVLACCSATSRGSAPVDLSSLPEIVEIVPNSCDIKGGVQVLLLGDWYMKGHEYMVLVKEKQVVARLIRPGVLSFIAPPVSNPCEVFVRVLCKESPVSQNITFMYEDSRQHSYMLALLDRIHVLCLAFSTPGMTVKVEALPIDENSILNFLRSLQYLPLTNPLALGSVPGLPSRTILHLTAALDYWSVIEFILQWRRSLPYCREFDPLARDIEGDTPMHYAAQMGYVNSAKILVEHASHVTDVLNDRGKTPLDVAVDGVAVMLSESRDSEAVSAQSADTDSLEHVTSTALWVMTNGETVTDQHLLHSKRCTDESKDSSSAQLHVEISMDTDVHLPDSPKMADLFQAATSPGILNDDVRQSMATLARQIIDALPDRIKNQNDGILMDDELLSANVFFGSNFPQSMCISDDIWPSSQFGDAYGVHIDNDVVSTNLAATSMSGSDVMRTEPSSLCSTRMSTLDSTSLDFDKDLGEFFSAHVNDEIDPIQQRLGNLKLSDAEQRDLYQAAMVIQRAYREYRERSTYRRQQVDVERKAAITIQCCYRRYKQFCYFKKLHSAAIVVQKHFRLKKVNQKEAIPHPPVQEHPTMDGQILRIQVPQTSSSLSREHRAAKTIQVAYRGHRKRQAAARTIQKFMKESRQKLQKLAEQNGDAMSATQTVDLNGTIRTKTFSSDTIQLSKQIPAAGN